MESPAKKKILDALAEATRHFAWNDLSGLKRSGTGGVFRGEPQSCFAISQRSARRGDGH